MSATMATKTERPEELRIFVERFMHFMNLWTIYKDILTGHYVPSVGTVQKSSEDNTDAKDSPVNISVMFVLYAYFYSLVEDSDDGLNGFRVEKFGRTKKQPSQLWSQSFCHLWTGSGYSVTDSDSTGAERGAMKRWDLIYSISTRATRFTTR
jgi:hypothetical protein